ncbi:MAG: type II toxin-antitoxin system HicB family antitoxin [Chloroflexi bacterium]|nr:type II toxin-antitoxin system HicB family antitoxin [Chloroflexota bacterium]
MKSEDRRSLVYYLSLEYPVTIHRDADGGGVAEFEDLPGCLTQADTVAELLEMAEDAKRSWLTTAYETGLEIPLPRELDEYKGKILVRVTRSLHRELAAAAKRQGVSLNQYIANLLSAGVHAEIIGHSR